VSFDLDTFVGALTPPAFTVGGRTYHGRVLSVEQWIALHGASGTLTNASDVTTTRAFIERAFLAWFPAPWYARGPLACLHRAWQAFRRLPDVAQLAAIESFSSAQRAAMMRPALGPTATLTASP
jgi:hypothetical protein